VGVKTNTDEATNPLDGVLRLYTTEETAQLLKVSKQIVYGLVRRKKLRPLAGFGRLRFSAAEIAPFVSQTK